MKRLLAVALLLSCLPAHAYRFNDIDFDHWISDKSEQGAFLVLEDGTVWGIDPVDQVKTSIWLTTDHVAIFKSSSASLYPYLIIDQPKEERVHAKYIGRT